MKMLMRSAREYSSAQFMSTAKISGMAFSADQEKILFTSDASGILNAYEAAVSTRTQRQLTDSVIQNIQRVSYFPNDERILVSKDCGNHENSVLCVWEPQMLLTPGEKVQAFFHCWSRDQRSFFVLTNERDQRRFDLYRFDAHTLERTLIYRVRAGFYFAGLSEDEQYILLLKSESKSDADIFLCAASTGELKCLTPHKGDILNCAPVFDRHSTAIY